MFRGTTPRRAKGSASRRLGALLPRRGCQYNPADETEHDNACPQVPGGSARTRNPLPRAETTLRARRRGARRGRGPAPRAPPPRAGHSRTRGSPGAGIATRVRTTCWRRGVTTRLYNGRRAGAVSGQRRARVDAARGAPATAGLPICSSASAAGKRPGHDQRRLPCGLAKPRPAAAVTSGSSSSPPPGAHHPHPHTAVPGAR